MQYISIWLTLVLCAVAVAQNPVVSPFPPVLDTDQTLSVAKNSASSTLPVAINASATTFGVTSGAAFLIGNIITIGTEKMQITAIAGNNITVSSRGYGGTTAATHPIGSTVAVFIEASAFNATAAAIKAVQGALGANLINISPALFHVTQQALPTPVGSPTSPTSAEGNALTYSVLVNSLVIVNTDTTQHTVTVQDCAATPFKLFTAYPIAASTTWTLPLNMTFVSCFKWSSDSALVKGAATGQKVNADGSLPTATQGIGAIDPTVLQGDMIIRGPAGLVRLPGPTNGTWCWNFAGGVATFVNCPSGFANPMTTAGDLIIGGSGGAAARLPAASGYLHWNGTAFVYDSPAAVATLSFGAIANGTSLSTIMQVGNGSTIQPTGTGIVYANGIGSVALSTLGTGIYKFTAGVPSLAIAGTDYQAALGYTAENANNRDTDGQLTANDNAHYPTDAAVRTYVAAHGGAGGGGTTYTSGLLDWAFVRVPSVLTYGSNCLPGSICNASIGGTRYGFSGGPYTLTVSATGAHTGTVCSYISNTGTLSVNVGGASLVVGDITASGGVPVISATAGACPADSLALETWNVTGGTFDTVGTAYASYLSYKPSPISGSQITVTPGSRDTIGLSPTGSTGHSVCWKSASTLGYCSTQPDGNGNCSCN